MKRLDSSDCLVPAQVTPARVHGGPDALGAPRFDFSTNSNACGPCPQALAAVQQADASRYPDASYAALRTALADFHAVAPWRIVLGGSASECIFRITAWVRQRGGQTVNLPAHAYGDYAHAAHAWGLQAMAEANAADLVWACEPSSPLGQAHAAWPILGERTVVLDCAYAPLRLSGAPSLSAAQREQVWQLFSPNKSMGLTGVRAAYAIAPLAAESAVAQLDALAPSWVLGAHGQAMLQAWISPQVQTWLAHCLPTLRAWKARQTAMLRELGWTCLPSEANYFCAQAPQPLDLNDLRAKHGIKLRDCASFGLPGWLRLGVLPPQAQDALVRALQAMALTETVLENVQ